MIKKSISFLAIACASISNVFASSLASPGYYDIPNSNNEVLGLANMNEEFKITSLMNSALINDYKAAEIFLNTGANVNDVNIANVTALHLASRSAAHETAQILLRYGATVDPRDLENWTPLMRASLAGDLEMIKILMNYGANAWNQNNYGDTPLVHATMADCYECVKYILENGGNSPYPSLLNNQLQKALDIANKRYNEDIIKLLKDALKNQKNNGQSGKFSLGDNDNLNPNDDSNLHNDKNSKYRMNSTGTIVELLYIFLGRTVSAQEIAAMGEQTYIHSKNSYYDRTPMTRSQVRCSSNLKNCKKVTLVNTSNYNMSNSIKYNTNYNNNNYIPVKKEYTLKGINNNYNKYTNYSSNQINYNDKNINYNNITPIVLTIE